MHVGLIKRLNNGKRSAFGCIHYEAHDARRHTSRHDQGESVETAIHYEKEERENDNGQIHSLLSVRLGARL